MHGANLTTRAHWPAHLETARLQSTVLESNSKVHMFPFLITGKTVHPLRAQRHTCASSEAQLSLILLTVLVHRLLQLLAVASPSLISALLAHTDMVKLRRGKEPPPDLDSSSSEDSSEEEEYESSTDSEQDAQDEDDDVSSSDEWETDSDSDGETFLQRGACHPPTVVLN